MAFQSLRFDVYTHAHNTTIIRHATARVLALVVTLLGVVTTLRTNRKYPPIWYATPLQVGHRVKKIAFLLHRVIERGHLLATLARTIKNENIPQYAVQNHLG